MPRITREELGNMDLEWFGVDKKGQVAVFCSAGVGNVPEFVCCDEEKNDNLVELFDLLPCISKTKLCFEVCESNKRPVEVAVGFSEKGLFYFDSDDATKSKMNVSSLQKFYTIHSKPQSPILFDDLSIEIRNLLKDNCLPVFDYNDTEKIEVTNAY